MRVGLQALLDSAADVTVLFAGARISELVYDGELSLPIGTDVVVAYPESIEAETLSHYLLQRDSQLAILLLSDDPYDLHTIVDLPLHAWGILSADVEQDELLAAVRALYAGLFVGEPALIQPLLNRVMVSADDIALQVEELTERETEVLQLLAQGLANKQIALELGISSHTVKFHISSIFTKLDVVNRIEAVTAGARLGIVVL